MNIFSSRLVSLAVTLTVALLMPLINTVTSAAMVQTTSLMSEYAYDQVPSIEESSSSIPSSFETNSNVTTKMDTTKIANQDNNSKTELELPSNSSLFFKNQLNNETGTFSNITNIDNITTIGASAEQGSHKVSGDFNGDGSDDLAIGIPFEDEEIGGSSLLDLPVASISASGNDGNVPQNVLDKNLSTRWSSLGTGQYITADLGSPHKITNVDIAWYKGNERQNHFVISTSTDGTIFTNRLTSDSSGTTTSTEAYTVPSVNARYVRVTVNGNTQNNWASITELEIFGPSPSHTIFDSGAVNVIYGSSTGLSATALSSGNGRSDQRWTQAITGGLEPYDAFGSALATGDFNKDGFSDLAIGVRGEDIDSGTSVIPDVGAVNVIYGSSNGLSASGNQIWTQNTIGWPARAAAGDWFGYALATGDFNKDGITDLAVGVPREDVNTHHGFMIDAGAVDVIYGSLAGLNTTATPNEEWTQYTPSLQFWWDDAEDGDWFGARLTTGDFNKDGYSELAIGVPREDVGTFRNAGQVNMIYYGIPTGAGVFLQTWTQNSTGIEDVLDNDDEFSSALTTGDFNKDGFSDLAIGVQGEDVGPVGNTVMDAGAVNVIYGSLGGLWPIKDSAGDGRDDQIWTQNSPNIEDDAEDGDIFGDALTTGDFNKDGYSDLVIGVSAEDLGTVELVGAVNVVYGSSQGLSPVRLSASDGRADQLWTQNSTNVDDDAESIDLFGFALTTGDFNKDGISDLVIGVPLEDVDTIGNAGAVNVIYGSLGITINSGGLSATVPVGGTGKADQIWTQNSPNIEDDAEASDEFGIFL